MANEDQIDEHKFSSKALTKSYAHDVMKIKGNYQNKGLLILIYSESTRNFIYKHEVVLVQ